MSWGTVAIAIAVAVVWMLAWSIYFLRCRNRLVSIRNAWMERFGGDDAEQSRKYHHLVQRTAEVGRLIRGAGVPDGQVPFAKPVGWGQLVTGNASLFDNWLAVSDDVPTAMNTAFLRAIGVYDDRRRGALNPLW